MAPVRTVWHRLVRSTRVVAALLLLPAAVSAYPSWQAIVANNPNPAGRAQHSAIFDPIGNRMIVFGGQESQADTWALSLESPEHWQQLDVGTPGARRGASAVYDPVRKRMIIFGGFNGTWLNDVWVLPLDPLGTWTPLTVTGTAPVPRMVTPIVYDSAHDRLLLFGGWSGTQPMNDTWALALSPGVPAWSPIPATGPGPRYGHIAFYKPSSDEFYIYGGIDGGALGDVWKLSLTPSFQWTQVSPSGIPPAARYYGSGVYVPAVDAMFTYGGEGTSVFNDLWSLDLRDQPTWVTYTGLGSPPPPLFLHTSVYDSNSGRMIVFGPNPTTGVAYALNVVAVTAPFISSLSQAAARVGDPIQIRGGQLASVTTVKFGGDVAAPIESQSAIAIDVHVPSGARTGPITVSGSMGAATSSQLLFVGDTPLITSTTPDSGRYGDTIEIRGRYFEGASRVAFGPSSRAAFTVIGDTLIRAAVDSLAVSGPVSVTNPLATGTSSASFHVILPSSSARIVSVRDIRGDQGGRVAVKWLGSELDLPNRRGIALYRVWRRAPLASAAVRPEGSLRAGPPGFWEAIGEVPAIGISGYAFTASTPSDSSADGNPYTAFFVQTVTDTTSVFYLSAVDSGYSVDNLAPAMPASFRASFGVTTNTLQWHASAEADLREYRVYRGSSVDFPLDTEHLLRATRDTITTDAAGARYYKLVAVDVHGNRSRAAILSPDGPVATLAALASSELLADGVRLTWFAEGLQGASMTLERADAPGAWTPHATVSVDGEGYVRYEERGLEPGSAYGYRLVYTEEGVEFRSGEVWLRIPGRQLAIESVSPNPASSQALRIAFRLSPQGEGTIELIDVSGRRWASARVQPGAAGQTWQPTHGAHWPAGLYLVRLRQGGETRTARVVLVD